MINDIIHKEYQKMMQSEKLGSHKINEQELSQTKDYGESKKSCFNEKGEYDEDLCEKDIQRRDWEG